MKITYQSRTYSPEKVTARYVRKSTDGYSYSFCEVDAQRYDIRRGVVNADEVPEEIRKKADGFAGLVWSYVEWPI
jgi:hypothetical protein